MHVLRYLLWTPLTLALLALLGPILIATVLLVSAFTVPFLLWMWTPFGAPEEGGRWEATRELFLIWLYILPVLMILRASVVLVYALFPVAMQVVDTPLLALFGPEFLPRVDLALALAGGGMLLLLALQDTLWRVGQLRNLSAMPYSRLRSASVGLVRLQGRAQALAPQEAGKTILRQQVSPDTQGSQPVQGVQFWIEDDSGRILVDTTGALFSGDLGAHAEQTGAGEYSGLFTDTMGNRVCEVLLPAHATGSKLGIRGYTLEQGDTVTLLGTAQPLPQSEAEALGIDADTLVVRPRRGLFGDRYHDVFILSNGEGRPLRRHFLQGALYGWLFALFGLLLAFGHGSLSLRAMDDFEAAYGYPPPVSEAPVPPAPKVEVPLLERSIETPQTPGRVTVAELLELLHTAAPGNVLHYVGYLDRLGARELAAEELRRIVLADDDPTRVQVAESTLRGWALAVPARPTPPPPPLREQRITDPHSGLELSVDDMLRAIHVAPVDEVRWYLNLLDSLGARQLAINELKLVVIEDADVERVRMARSRLITWNVNW